MSKRKEMKEKEALLTLGPLNRIMLAKCEPIKFDNPNIK